MHTLFRVIGVLPRSDRERSTQLRLSRGIGLRGVQFGRWASCQACQISGRSRPRSGTGRLAARAQARTSAVLGCGAASARLSLGLMRDLNQLGVVDPAGFRWRGPQMGLWLSPGLVQVVAQHLRAAGVAQL
jgi:hypothetical protein